MRPFAAPRRRLSSPPPTASPSSRLRSHPAGGDAVRRRSKLERDIAMAASDTPGVIAPPPLLYAAFFLGGWGLDYLVGLNFPGSAVLWWTIGGLLALAGVGLGLAAVYQFFRAGTNVL